MIVYGRSLRLDVFLLTISVVLCVGALRAILGEGDAPEIFSFLPFDLAAWGWLVLFSGAGFKALGRILDHRPRLVLSDEGILTRTPTSGELRLAWSEIKDVRDRGFGCVGIDLWDPREVEARMSPVRRLWMRISQWLGEAPLTLNGFLIRAPSTEVFTRMRDELDRRLLADVRSRRSTESDVPGGGPEGRIEGGGAGPSET